MTTEVPVRSFLSETVVSGASSTHRNLTTPVLYEHMVKRGEGKLLQGGTFAVRSGDRTGRSPKDKFVIKAPGLSELVWWGPHNQALSVDAFEGIREKAIEYLKGRELYIQDCVVSQDPEHRRTVRVIYRAGVPQHVRAHDVHPVGRRAPTTSSRT